MGSSSILIFSGGRTLFLFMMDKAGVLHDKKGMQKSAEGIWSINTVGWTRLW